MIVVELGSLGARGQFVPLMMAGIGLDDANANFSDSSGYHIEGGFGLEYRADGGLVIGGDARMGGRSVTMTT